MIAGVREYARGVFKKFPHFYIFVGSGRSNN